jgi:signal transduction histidine kinase
MPRFSAKSDLRAIVPCKSNKRVAFKQIRRTGVDTASEVHAGTRLRSGFSIDQLVTEYRALRASVMLLWSRQPDRNPEFREQDALRFNEAIDKGLAESVSRYSQAVNESQDVFLGVLGHDLRSPLAVILLSAEFFLNADEWAVAMPRLLLASILDVRRAEKIVENLLDFARARVGSGIPVDRIEDNLTQASMLRADHHPKTKELGVSTSPHLSAESEQPPWQTSSSNPSRAVARKALRSHTTFLSTLMESG